MTGVIHEKRGTIDKYMGDAIMAFWGAPLDDEDHAKHALEAALIMQDKMQELNVNLSAKNLPSISIVIGVNTGIMSVGNMGSEFRMAYTVIGDSVNLAARLEALTRVYGVQIMIGENTRKSLKNTLCLELDKVIVKGKGQAVSVYEPIGAASEMTPDQEFMIEKQQQALQLYREQNWSMAIRNFQELKEKFPEKYVFELYLERIEQFLETPPGPDWDGVFKFTTK
jgi:adenylate cyclase